MQRRWKTLSAVLAIAIIGIGIAIAHAGNRADVVERADPERFKRELAAAAAGKPHLDMAAVTDFEWDRLHIFGPYTSWEEMEQAAGTSWSTGSLPGDLLRRTSIGRYPLDDDSLQKLVFLLGDKVVLDVTLMRRDLDFTSVLGKHDRARAAFDIDRTMEYPTAVLQPLRE
jgi:hypothetical protein